MATTQFVVDDQFFLNSKKEHPVTNIWSSQLLIPSYFALLSVAILVLRVISNFKFVQKILHRPIEEPSAEQPSTPPVTGLFSEATESIKRNGGPVVFTFNLLRFLGCLASTCISIAAAALLDEEHVGALGKGKKHWGKKHRRPPSNRQFSPAEWIEISLCLFYAYCSLISLLSLTLKTRSRLLVTRHATLLLVVAFGIYAYRDIWPFATFNLTPLDPDNWLTWSRIGILGMLAVVSPLITPRVYIPVDPSNPSAVVNPEQTASYLSFMLFSFMDPLVFEASSVPHLPYDSLPPLPDYDHASYLQKRSFPLLDPTLKKGKRRHMFWGLLQTFHYEFIQLVGWMSLKTIIGFVSPLGIFQLLNFIETGGKGHTIRPWVWIAGLFIGPLIGSIAMQVYVFINTANMVRIEGIITQLVFEHAFRIRMKDDVDTPSKPDDTTAVATPEVRSGDLQPEASTSSTDEGTVAEVDNNTTPASPKKGEPSVPAIEDTAKPEKKGGNLTGRINNLISTDLGNITDGRDFLFLVLYGPLQIIICIWFLSIILSWAAVVGFALMAITFPIPGYVAKLINKVQEERMKRTDARVQEVTESMNIIRMIKLFAWEPKVMENLAKKRDDELTWFRKRQILDLTNMNLNYVLPLVTMIGTFTFYTLVMGERLSASRVFSSMAVFDLLRDQLHMAFWFVGSLIQAKVSLERVDTFLHDTELLDDFTPHNNASLDLVVQNKDTTKIGFRNATFSWTGKSASAAPTPGRRNFTLHIDGDLFFQKGKLNLVIGPTGCGKTSLLMALLSEMHFEPSVPDSWFSLPREGGVAFCAQESWVQNETIKNNILFGSAFDEERYKKVIYQCALERDLTLFDAGDETEVGEKGLTLSGGQKARVTLARAVYSGAEILLLDDILAALDVHTSKWIVDKLFTGDLVTDRTIILVTHNVAMTTPIADYVVSIGLNGHILSQGTVDDALRRDSQLLAEVKKDAEILKAGEAVIDAEPEKKEEKKADGKLIVKEEVALGRVSWTALKLFLRSLGGALFWISFLTGMLLADLLSIFQTYWLGYWASKYEDPDADVPVPYYLSVYAAMLMAGIVIYSSASIVYLFGSLRASRLIHNKLASAMLGTTLRWLDTTPIGRVISRFSMDLRTIDGPISGMLSGLVELTLSLVLKFLAVVSFSPIFAIPGAIVAAAGGWLGQIYIRAQLAVKREMSNSKSPVFSHFGAAIAGLVSIRAYGAQNAFKAESLRRIDLYTRPARTYYNLNRWICIRVDALGGVFAAGLAAWLVYGPGSSTANASETGFSLTMAVAFSGMILWWVRTLNEFEVQGNSLERIDAYLAADQEPKATADGKPPAYWPASGTIRAEELSASYSEDGPKVLNDITFEIQSGERVGIVGRTGSGKSSLTLSLLRLIPSTGTVYYDGIATNRINLDALRSNITIIPQQPELLSGSLRQNLDPFQEHEDATLNAALQASGLYSLQTDNADDRIGLDTAVTAGGSNFSLGQRQIIALARAIVRGSKVMILDEATAGVDYDTDAVIQKSIRKELSGVTLIIVAHRLATVMDADKIMVLDAGKMVEFGSPYELLQHSQGHLRSLVDQSGDREELIAMTKRGHA